LAVQYKYRDIIANLVIGSWRLIRPLWYKYLVVSLLCNFILCIVIHVYDDCVKHHLLLYFLKVFFKSLI